MKILTQSPLHAHILARDLLQLELIRSARLAQIWITFPHRQIARTLLGVALSLAATSWEAILTVAAAITEFLAEVLGLDAGAVHVARTCVVAGRIVVYMV